MKFLYYILRCLLILFSIVYFKTDAQVLNPNKQIELSIKRNYNIGTSGIAKGPNLIKFTNYYVKDILIELLSNQGIIEISNLKLNRERLDITLNTKSFSFEEGKNILIDSIVDRYNLKIIKKTQKINVWSLSLIDIDKLNQSLSFTILSKNKNISRKEEFNGTKLLLTNTTIKEASESISHLLNEFIENDVENGNKYNLELTVLPITVLQKQLEMIGLRLVKTKRKIHKINIS